MSSKPSLQFTGERFTPECEREMAYEHWHRYVFARSFVAGRRVLDLACGEGYGSALLSDAASQVIGMDVDQATLAHARTRYADMTNLSFEIGDCAKIPAADASLDAVVSFETLEHIKPQREFVAECRRVLAADGILLISTPDKRTYSDLTGYQNEFHVAELYRDEFLALLHDEFPAVRLYGQKLMFQSMIWQEDGEASEFQVATADEAGQIREGLQYDPIYLVACCAASEAHLPSNRTGLWSFGDAAESIYRHYDDEVRRNIHARGVLAAYETRIQELEAQLAAADGENTP